MRQGSGFISYTTSAAGGNKTAEVEWWGHKTSKWGEVTSDPADKLIPSFRWPRCHFYSHLKQRVGLEGAGRNNAPSPGRKVKREETWRKRPDEKRRAAGRAGCFHRVKVGVTFTPVLQKAAGIEKARAVPRTNPCRNQSLHRLTQTHPALNCTGLQHSSSTLLT